MSTFDLKEIKIWNIKYNLLTEAEIADIVVDWISKGKRGIHITGVNADIVGLAQDDVFLREAILDSDIVNVDSMLPAHYLQKRGYSIKGRVATPDVMEELLKKANERGQKVYFLGAKQDTLDKLKTVLEDEYPNLQIVGMQNGYYDVEEEEQIVSRINESAPDYLFIAFPSPRKEQFILKYKHSIDVGVFYGIGGALDAKAGVLKRPPKWLRGFGIEGVLRVIRKPGVHIKRMPLTLKFFDVARRPE
ncbi:MAG: WecB/TagA/CpsF family glycosyltransferase [Bacteroidales bacterium]|nr:WecB/TagA/CpsF family glycosyltransferase [Bacteroidales bacterium]